MRATVALLAEQECQRAYDCQQQGQGSGGPTIAAALEMMQAGVVE
ncbi:hypothetical protein [Pseudoduganella rhizocola]